MPEAKMQGLALVSQPKGNDELGETEQGDENKRGKDQDSQKPPLAVNDKIRIDFPSGSKPGADDAAQKHTGDLKRVQFCPAVFPCRFSFVLCICEKCAGQYGQEGKSGQKKAPGKFRALFLKLDRFFQVFF